MLHRFRLPLLAIGITIIVIALAVFTLAREREIQELQGALSQSRESQKRWRNLADDLENKLEASQGDAADASARVEQLQAELDALKQELQSRPVAATSPSRPPLVIRLTDQAVLRAYANRACQARAGANARPEGQEQFIVYFHGLEREQQERAYRGQTYFTPDPDAQALEFARTRSGVCY